MDTRFVWVDLEMTGLDPQSCHIIEFGMIITDAELRPLAELERAVWQPESHLEPMSPFVREMHTRNGLLEKVRRSTVTVDDVEREALALVLEHCAFREGILAGNSIHTDRRFLLAYMPSLERVLHYRQLDVSSLKVLVQAWSPAESHFRKGNNDHTAIGDLHASMEELTHYRQLLFRP